MAFAALFVGGLGFLDSVTSATTVLQLEVDDAMRGRIMALWSVAFLGLRPVGSLVDGAVASAAGVRAGALTMAVPAFVGAGAMVALHRRPRRR